MSSSDDKPRNVQHLQTGSVHHSVQSALADAQAVAAYDDVELAEVLIVGTFRDGSLFVRSSRMSRAEALWLARMGEDWALSGGANVPAPDDEPAS